MPFIGGGYKNYLTACARGIRQFNTFKGNVFGQKGWLIACNYLVAGKVKSIEKEKVFRIEKARAGTTRA